MTTTGKFSFQPSIGNHFCQTYAQNTLAHAEDVGIVMLTAHFSGENITAQSSANTLAFISSDRNTDTGTANQDALLRTAGTAGNILAQLSSIVGIIYRIFAVGTMVNNLDAFIL